MDVIELELKKLTNYYHAFYRIDPDITIRCAQMYGVSMTFHNPKLLGLTDEQATTHIERLCLCQDIMDLPEV